MKKYAIKSKKVYEKDGEKKHLWLGVGTLIEFDNGNMVLNLNHMPNEQFAVFPMDENNKEKWDGNKIKENIKYGEEDLPF